MSNKRGLTPRLTNHQSQSDSDSDYSSPELFDFLNQFHLDAVGTVRPNRKTLPKDVINCKLKKGGVAVHIQTNSWLSSGRTSSIHDGELKNVCDQKGGSNQMATVCIDYNDAMGGVYLPDQYLMMYSTI
jgi:hypothetical protein